MQLLRILAICAALIAVLPTTGEARECGLASWYHEGSRTANGEHYRPDGLTAAHRRLPFGTVLLVSHNGKQVRVRVNDRGPFIHGRFLDLSRGAAKIVGIIGSGVGKVCTEIVRPVERIVSKALISMVEMTSPTTKK
jgi:rare lipoprotein A